MTSIGEWLRRIRYLLNRGRLEAALQEEMDAHRSMMGEPRRFGNTLLLRETSRDVWGWAWLDALARDLRFAARGLRRDQVHKIYSCQYKYKNGNGGEHVDIEDIRFIGIGFK